MATTYRRILMLDSQTQRYQLRALPVGATHDPHEDYGLLSGESLCQYLLRETPDALILARGPLPFLPGNKTTVGYVSPLTGLPHYSFVGGRGFAELFNLGLDAIVFSGNQESRIKNQELANNESPPLPLSPSPYYLVISGRAPDIAVVWEPAADLPTGQRSAFYWLLERELGGNRETGSIFTLGEAARQGYCSANLGCDGLYHAGRGGAGYVFAQHAAALVLSGESQTLESWFHGRAEAFRELRGGELRQRLAKDCDRLSRRDGGTVTKLYATGSGDRPTLPAHNARRLGYALADLGARKILTANRVGQTGCHWCQVNCRHWHWVDVDYAPEGRDVYLDDFEPTYALFAMLDLQPENDSQSGKLRLLDEVDRRIVVPIEEMGMDIIDVGVGLAALFEGLEKRLIPLEDVPSYLQSGPYFGNLGIIAQSVQSLREGTPFPALHALGDGPQALAEHYPAMQDIVFTCGRGTLGNAGHANALWTFLMPFSRFFSHYSGQIYKVPGAFTPELTADEIRALFQDVVAEMLRREAFGCLGNALSLCAFTFVSFSEEGQGVQLDRSDLLVRTLATYGYDVQREDLEWFAEAFWAQSLVLKFAHGWRPRTAADFPARIFETIAPHLGRSPADLRALMDQLIAEWQQEAMVILNKYGYNVMSKE